TIGMFLLLLSLAAAPLHAQAPRPVNFLATHYDVSATLDAIGQSLSATAKIDLVATEASSNVRVELHPNLVVKEVKSPEGNPLTDYPSNRYTASFRLNVPATFAVAGSGKAPAPTPVPGKNAVEGSRLLYTFECNRPAQHGTFVAGNLQLNPRQAEGISVNVYAQRNQSANAQEFAADVARAAVAFSDMFGPIPDPAFTLIQLPEGTLREFAAPGVLLLSQRMWDPKASDRAIAHLVASQWWGVQVA